MARQKNPGIPEDEWLLAQAIAEAKARGLKWCMGADFIDATGEQIYRDQVQEHPEAVAACCAWGALELATDFRIRETNTRHYFRVAEGNDKDADLWECYFDAPDRGETLGYAYRCAMSDEQ